MPLAWSEMSLPEPTSLCVNVDTGYVGNIRLDNDGYRIGTEIRTTVSDLHTTGASHLGIYMKLKYTGWEHTLAPSQRVPPELTSHARTPHWARYDSRV